MTLGSQSLGQAGGSNPSHSVRFHAHWSLTHCRSLLGHWSLYTSLLLHDVCKGLLEFGGGVRVTGRFPSRGPSAWCVEHWVDRLSRVAGVEWWTPLKGASWGLDEIPEDTVGFTFPFIGLILGFINLAVVTQFVELSALGFEDERQ